VRQLILGGLIMLASTLSLHSTEAHATTLLAVDVPEMTLASEWIIRANVTSVRAVDLRAQGRGIFTDVTLQVREVYRGVDVPQTYVLRLLGGRGDDDMALWIPGMPRFVAGEEVVLFLEATSVGHIPCGLGQGVWRVQTTAAGATWTKRALGDVHLMRRAAHGGLEHAPVAPISSVRLIDDLVADIYAAQLGLPQP
jgi:hypothetical protein